VVTPEGAEVGRSKPRSRAAIVVPLILAWPLFGGIGAAAVSAQGTSAVASPVATQDPDAVVDFTAIQATDISLVLDPGGTSATISVSTTIDAACAVVFGEDETFGRLATDKDMGGAAHRDHHVVLGDLRPGTTYVYRFQGSAVDGRLYRSALSTFTTPTPSASEPVDLAVGARIDAVSSEYSDAYAATNAVDGDPSTEWSSAGDGDAAFITLDLGRLVDVTGVAFQTRQMSDGSAVTRSFTVTADGATLGPFPADVVVPIAMRAQVLRFDVASSTGGNTGATEIEVFGTDHDHP
jgi:hypothetical protein